MPIAAPQATGMAAPLAAPTLRASADSAVVSVAVPTTSGPSAATIATASSLQPSQSSQLAAVYCSRSVPSCFAALSVVLTRSHSAALGGGVSGVALVVT